MRSMIERFWEKVDVRGLDECWLWKGAVGKKHKYGVFNRGDRLRKSGWHYKAIARLFDVSYTTAYDAVLGHTWRSLDAAV